MSETTKTRSQSGNDGNPHRPAPLRLLQLTDLHLYADPGGRLLGQNTRRTFEMVVDLARKRFWPPDVTLLTGDLVHDSAPDGYRYLKQQLDAQGIPFFCVPGNHDLPHLIDSMLSAGSGDTVRGLQRNGWNLLLLDSTLRSSEGGHLSRSQLDGLAHALEAHRDLHTLIGLHHQPVPVGSTWLDSMVLDNADDLFAIIDRHPQVRLVLCGHIHQAFNARRGDQLLLGSPSTCIQFLPKTEQFALDSLTPGFRWLELFADGRIETGIERLAAYPEPLTLASNGY